MVNLVCRTISSRTQWLLHPEPSLSTQAVIRAIVIVIGAEAIADTDITTIAEDQAEAAIMLTTDVFGFW